MGWDKGRYYTRSRRVDGRVVREYVGTGPLAAIAARMDARDRHEREGARDADRLLRAKMETLDAAVGDLDELAELVARAALAVAGYRQHKRGEWRKQRVRPETT